MPRTCRRLPILSPKLVAETTTGQLAIYRSHAYLEAERNLSLKRPEAVERLACLARHVEISSATSAIDAGVGLPDKDIPILAAAVASRCDVLITGDMIHFGRWIGTTVSGVRIMTARGFLSEVAEEPSTQGGG